ncbi:hypothetical protein BS50DRAFT_600017 [Corynespora cassiicola Philippines]|uniref:CENP-V/GFA domain-containing protein n=1 Tax=Corynespora cassiicola Philippines TaxID=1448308 RepID=A0A2T2NRI6_CORCC|nr:hypothetical protein BS50DRAFT_600017 [Corynespora cassiicola Philippines]
MVPGFDDKIRASNTSDDLALTVSVRESDKAKPYIPRSSVINDGWSKDDEATATCYCGTVQLAFPISGPGYVNSFVCNCTDCRKLTASMFTSGFIIDDDYLKHIRGQSNLKSYAQKETTIGHNLMTNFFCNTCGSLMYRVSERLPGHSILRLGTVDDFNLVETKLKPTMEAFIKDRVSWISGVLGESVKKFDTMPA